VHFDAERPPHRAANPVGRDQIAGIDDTRCASRRVAQHDPHPVGSVLDAHDLGAELDARLK
jgi:hypothetical protein